MSDKKKLNLPAMAAVHAAAAAALAVGADALTGRLHSGMTALAGVAVGALLVVVLGWWMTRKHQTVRHHAKTLAGHHLVRTAILAWVGIGLAVSGLAHLATLLARPHGPMVSTGGAVVAGPFAAPQAARTGAGWVWALLACWAVGWTYGLASGQNAFRGNAKHVLGAASKGLGASRDRAPDKEPTGAHFAAVTGGLDAVVVSKREVDNRLLLGTAELASDWGRRLRTHRVALAEEGSAILFGGPGSGKSTIFQTMLLNSHRPRSGEKLLPTRFVVLSTKPRDLAGPTVNWLRQQGPVAMWDLTGKTVGSDRYGDVVRWSPLSAVTDWDTAKRLAKKLVESGRDADSRERDSFWLQQAMSLIAPCLLAAKLNGKEYGDALAWSAQWTTAAFDTVDRVLAAHDQAEALHSWVETRKMLLTEARDGSGWEENRGAGGAATTGLSINATLSGLLLSLSSESARTATRDPNFDPVAWVRGDGPAGLFLVGDWQAPETSRSLLVPIVNSLLDEAYRYATEFDTEKLPYRLVVLGDELANLAPIEGLDRYFSTARSHGIQILAAFQSYGQIEQTYGRHVARTLIDASAATVVLSGIRDRDLIALLGQAGGSEHIEAESETTSGDTTSKTTSMQARTLIEGHHITQMRGPTAERPGDGLLLVPGAVVKIRVPLWARTEPFCRRGTPSSDRAETHAQHLRQLDRRPSALAKRASSSLHGFRDRHGSDETPDASSPDVDGTQNVADVCVEPAPQMEAHDPAPAPETTAGPVSGTRSRRVRATPPVGESRPWPPSEAPTEVVETLTRFAGSRAELFEAVAGGATSEADARLLLGHMVAPDAGGIEWGLAWDGTPQWRQPGATWQSPRKAA